MVKLKIKTVYRVLVRPQISKPRKLLLDREHNIPAAHPGTEPVTVTDRDHHVDSESWSQKFH
jgi:hypothetical protein